MDLLCVGLTTLDILGRPITGIPQDEATHLIEGIEVIPAGTAGGAALVAAILGLDTELVAAVGDDRIGRIILSELRDLGVGTRSVKTLPNVSSSATILAIDEDGRRPNFHALGASGMLEIDAAAIEAAKHARFVHWGGVGAPQLDGGSGARLLSAARRAGAVVTCDLISPGPSALDELRRLLPHVTWFLPSAREALALTQACDLVAAARTFLEMGAGGCIIKDGTRGSILVERGKEPVRVPAFAIEAIDTTSCGDSFCAGFIAALARDWSTMDAVRFASAVAAHVAQGLGTLGLLAGFDETAAAMDCRVVAGPVS